MASDGSWSPSSFDAERPRMPFNIENPSAVELKGEARPLSEEFSRTLSDSFLGIGEDSRHAGYGNSAAGYAAMDEEAYRAAARSRFRWNLFIFGILVTIAAIICLIIVLSASRKKSAVDENSGDGH